MTKDKEDIIFLMDWLIEMEDFVNIHMLGNEENMKNMYKLIVNFVEKYPATKSKLMAVLKHDDLKTTSFEAL